MEKICILGGGLSGLIAALECIKYGYKDLIIIEGNENLGGLMRTKVIDGFTFDIGGSHIIFSRKQHLLEILLRYAGRTVQHKRDARIFFRGKYIKFPFENGMYLLSPEIRYRIISEYIRRYIQRLKNEVEKPKNFKEWLYYWFGNGLTEIYLEPYNKKIWKIALEKIGINWVKGRVPDPPVEDLLKSAVGIPTEGYKHQLNFYYPLEGGIETIIRNLKDEIRKLGAKIFTNYPVDRIKYEDNKFIVRSRNKEILCDIIINTIPIIDFIRIFSETPTELKKKTEKFYWTSVLTVGLAVRGERILDHHWVYFPQKEIIFHRIAILSNYSPKMAPNGHSIILAEITLPKGSLRNSMRSMVSRVVEDLARLKIIKKDDVIFIKTWYNRYGYPVEHLSYCTDIVSIMKFLAQYRVISVGRWGEWKYLNMDAIIDSVSNKVRDYLRRITKEKPKKSKCSA